jgi:hypothetical protein
MTLKANAQEQFTISPVSPASQLPAADTHFADGPSFEVVEAPEIIDLLEQGQHDGLPIEVADQEAPLEVEITIGRLPGAPDDSPEPQPPIEVSEEPIDVEDQEKPEDANDAKKGKNDKWNWSKHGPTGFIAWIKERIDNVPRHSGLDTAGLERAQAYLEKLDSEISKAMRMDLDEELDANQIEKVRAQIDDGIARLNARLEKVKKNKKSVRRKKSEYEYDEDGFVKEAQKITGVQGIFVTVPLMISSLARTCINGMVSAGHDIERMYGDQVQKYKLNDREQLELRQCLWDMGYPMRIDMGVQPEEDLEVSDSDNYNWATNYKA